MHDELLKNGRKFKWISSVSGDPKALSLLNERMARFYDKQENRKFYQAMLNSAEEYPAADDSDICAIRYIYGLKHKNILEVGCARGRLYRQLHKCGYKGTYCGIEVSEYIIKQDIHRHPEASWLCGTAYGIPFADRSFDLCFAFYVLEHLVYPKRALAEMMRVIKPGGHLALVFPDFVESGRLGSQQLGYSAADTALQKIRKGKIVDALVSLYDSRIRLPIALKTMKTTVGDFPVNSNPVCLSCPGAIGHDMDAVYIASKREVREWATVNNCSVKYPFGVKGKYILYAFMVIAK